MTAATYNQNHFRGRDDSVGLNSGTFTFALDTNFSQTIGVPFRVRFSILHSGNMEQQNYTLQWVEGAGTYATITASSKVKWALSGQYANGDATSQIISSGAFVAGQGVEGAATNLTGINLNSNSTEIEWCLELDSSTVSAGNTFSLRIVGAGASVFTGGYTTPTITAAAAGGGATVAPTTGALSVVGQAPTASTGAVVAPSTSSLTVTGFAPAVIAASTGAPTAGSLSVIGQAPAVVASAVLEPTTSALTIVGFAPTVDTAASFTGEPTTGALAITGAAPTPTAAALVEPSNAALQIIGFAPTVAVPYVANPVNFDGANDYLTRGAALSGIADSASFTGSIWCRRTGGYGVFQRIFASPPTSRVSIFFDNTNADKFGVACRDNAGVIVLSALTNSAITDSNWHHIMFSFDGTNAHIYLDGQSDINVSVHTDTAIDFDGPTNWSIGGSTAGANLLSADVADLQLWVGTYLDLSQAGNRALFLADSKPVDPATAAATLGTPIVLQAGPTGTWETNDGTGGGFTENGALSDGTGPVQLSGDRTLAPATGSINVVGQAPTVQADVIAAPGPGSLIATGNAPAVTAAAAAEPTSGSLTFTGFAPAVAAEGEFSGTPATASLTLSGLAPELSSGATVIPTTAAVAITGFAPTVDIPTGTVEIGAVEWLVSYEEVILNFTATPPTGALVVTGQAPTLAASSTAEPAQAALAITGGAPAVSATATVAPSVATLVITGFAPSVAAEGAFTGQPDAGALVLTGQAPTAQADASVEAGAASLLVSTLTPNVAADSAISAQLGVVAITGLATEVAAGALLEPSAGALTTAAFAPTVTATATAEPANGSLTFTGFTPDVLVSGSFSGTPQTAAVSVTGLAPTVTASAAASSTTAAVNITGLPPTVDIPMGTVEIGAVEWLVAYEIAQQDFTGTPTAGSLTITSFAPSVSTTGDATALPGAGSLVVAGVLPTVAASSAVEPGAGQAVVTAFAPTVSAFSGVSITPATGSLSIAGQAPTTQTNNFIAPGTGSVVVTGYAPAVAGGTGAIVTTQTGTLVVVGAPPSFAGHVFAAANSGSLAFIGWAPTLEGEQIVEPPTGSIAIEGYPPFIIHLPVPSRRVFEVARQDRGPRIAARDAASSAGAFSDAFGDDFDSGSGAPLLPVGEADRQFAATGRRRVFRVSRRN